MSGRPGHRLVVLAAVQAAGHAATLGWNVIGARVAPVHDYGVVSLAISIVLALQVLLEVGHQRTLVKYLGPLLAAGDFPAANRLCRRALRWPLLAGVLVGLTLMATAAGAGAAWGGLPLRRWFLLLPAGLGAALMSVQTGAFIAAGRAVASSALSLVAVPVVLCGAFAWLGRCGRADAGSMLTAVALAYAAGGVYSAARLLRGAPGPREDGTIARVRPTGPSVRSFYRFALAAQAVALVSLGLGYADRFLLGALASFAAVGLYSLAARTARLLNLPVYFLHPVSGPVYAELGAGRSPDTALAVYRASARFIATVVLPFGLMAMVYARPLLVTLGGTEFAAAAGTLRILLAGVLVVTMSGNGGLLLQLGGAEACEVRATVVGLVVNVVVALLLLGRLGIVGVAIGTATGLAVVATVRLHACYQRWRVSLADLGSRRQAVAVVLFLAGALAAREAGVGWGGGAAAGVVAAVLANPPWRALRELAGALARVEEGAHERPQA